MNRAEPDWFARDGLRFSCTQCGNCCTGPEGYVLIDDAETRALADHLGMDMAEFERTYTRRIDVGGRRQARSLTEHRTEFGFDCVFLDRERVPGKAVCGVYEARPTQCRTWPFWKANTGSPNAWRRAKTICPGMDTGQRHDAQHIRLTRERSPL